MLHKISYYLNGAERIMRISYYIHKTCLIFILSTMDNEQSYGYLAAYSATLNPFIQLYNKIKRSLNIQQR